MDFSLTPEEFKKLIELAYLGEWMVNAHHDNEFQDEPASAEVQRLLEAGAKAGVDGIDRDIETRQYFIDSEWADRLYDQYILDYDDHVFWDELTERLAQRDLAQKRGVSVDLIDREDDLMELKPLEDRYRRELERHGLERVDVPYDF